MKEERSVVEVEKFGKRVRYSVWVRSWDENGGTGGGLRGLLVVVVGVAGGENVLVVAMLTNNWVCGGATCYALDRGCCGVGIGGELFIRERVDIV